jgi:hypothetical protein
VNGGGRTFNLPE